MTMLHREILIADRRPVCCLFGLTIVSRWLSNMVMLTDTGQQGTYGAAASDISPGISGGMCSGNILMSQCAGQSVAPGYQAPGCPKTNCGKCYKVANKGGIGDAVGGVGNSITVQIIDACPSKSAYNFCKTDMPANQRCSDPGTNQLDIDKSAYMALTGQAYGGVCYFPCPKKYLC